MKNNLSIAKALLWLIVIIISVLQKMVTISNTAQRTVVVGDPQMDKYMQSTCGSFAKKANLAGSNLLKIKLCLHLDIYQ